MIVELGLQLAEADAGLADDIGIERQPVPVVALAVNACPPAHEIQIGPPTADHFGTAKARALHQQKRRPLMGESRPSKPRKLVQARSVDVRLPLRRSADLPRRVDVHKIFSLRPAEERMKHRDDVGARRSAAPTPAVQEAAEVFGRQ